MRQRHRKKITRNQRRIKNRVTLRTLFLLAITLIFNTYAWFMYIATVSSNLTAHVEAWHVQFKVDDQIVDRDFTVNIAHAYPGMEDVEKEVTIINDGEKDADIDFAIKSVRLFDDVYVASDQIESGDTIPAGADQTKTAAQLLSMIQNDYPFELSVESNQAILSAEDEGSLTITFTWDYEADVPANVAARDVTDTSYGTQAYDFYEANPGEDAIELVIKLIVTQHRETTP